MNPRLGPQLMEELESRKNAAQRKMTPQHFVLRKSRTYMHIAVIYELVLLGIGILLYHTEEEPIHPSFYWFWGFFMLLGLLLFFGGVGHVIRVEGEEMTVSLLWHRTFTCQFRDIRYAKREQTYQLEARDTITLTFENGAVCKVNGQYLGFALLRDRLKQELPRTELEGFHFYEEEEQGR